jgi:hypothetical protein
MYTETELREALQHSAMRADLLVPTEPESMSQAVELRVPIRTFQRRPWLPGVAAAGLAGAPTGVTAADHDADDSGAVPDRCRDRQPDHFAGGR